MEWIDIKGYEGLYQVSDEGIIRSLDRIIKYKNGSERFWKGVIIIPNIGKNGYHGIRLSKNSIIKRYLVHRIVLLSFDGYNILDINHKDGNKSNNNKSNLEWTTKSNNSKHAAINGLIKFKTTPIKLIKDDIIYEFNSSKEASIYIGDKYKNISQLKSGRLKSLYGYKLINEMSNDTW